MQDEMYCDNSHEYQSDPFMNSNKKVS